jgi:hypothetical protein
VAPVMFSGPYLWSAFVPAAVRQLKKTLIRFQKRRMKFIKKNNTGHKRRSFGLGTQMSRAFVGVDGAAVDDGGGGGVTGRRGWSPFRMVVVVVTWRHGGC